MSTVTVRSGFDTWAGSAKPALEHPREAVLPLRSGTAEAYLWFKVPAPPGATVTSATLTIRAKGASSGSRTITARRVSANWSESRLNWNNRPATVATSAATTTVGALTAGQSINLDVTGIVAAWAGGTQNYGFRVTTSASAAHSIHSLNSAYKPYLTVTWSDAPSKPVNLRPSEAATSLLKPHLLFDYLDVSGDTSLAAVQVQIDDAADFATPLFDSGSVASTSAGLDLAATSFAGFSPGSTYYWRVRAQDGAGLWSAWSDVVTLTRNTKPTLTITNVPVQGSAQAVNRIFDPSSADGNPSPWTAYSSTSASYVTLTSEVVDGRRAFMAYKNTASANMGGTVSVTGLQSVPAGQQVTISAYVRNVAGDSEFRIIARDDVAADSTLMQGTVTATNGTQLSTYVTFSVPVSPTWTRIWATFTVPAGRNVERIYVFKPVADVGDAIYFRDVMVATGPLVDFFDGDSVDTYPNEFSWDGTPYASTSTHYSKAALLDPSPPIFWSMTGQTRWRVLVYEAARRSKAIHDSGERTGAATSYTIPPGILKDGVDYVVEVRAWDSVTREATPGDPTYASTTAAFTLATDAATAGPSTLTATVSGAWVDLTWTRPTTPDAFGLYRDGVLIQSFDPADVFVSGSSYAFRYYGARPSIAYTYEVRAVVNGKTSAANPKATVATEIRGIRLVDVELGVEVTIYGDDEGVWATEDEASVYTPVGASVPIRITTSVRGLSGSLTGVLVDADGKTVAQQEAALNALKSRPERSVRLVAGDENFTALIGNVRVSPTPITRRGMTVKSVAFDFWQDGDLRFSPL